MELDRTEARRKEITKHYRLLSILMAQQVKNPPEMQETVCKVGNKSSIPGLGRPPGEGNDNPLQYSCLGNPMDKGAW